MEISCGKHRVKVSNIKYAFAVTLSGHYLYQAETLQNGPLPPKLISEFYPWLEDNLTPAQIEERQKRFATHDEFIEKYQGKAALYLKYNNGSYQYYIEGVCGFDVYEKESEFLAAVAEYEKQRVELEKQKAQQEAAQKAREEKIRNSYNRGEADVTYALKWILAANKGMFVPIIGDCESNHRTNCIWLKHPDFIDEPQEFDHILVCPAGVISIETKHWKDRVVIREDGKWIRQTDAYFVLLAAFAARCESFVD